MLDDAAGFHTLVCDRLFDDLRTVKLISAISTQSYRKEDGIDPLINGLPGRLAAQVRFCQNSFSVGGRGFPSSVVMFATKMPVRIRSTPNTRAM